MATKTKKVLSCLVVCLLVMSAMSVWVFAINRHTTKVSSDETFLEIYQKNNLQIKHLQDIGTQER